MIKRIDSNQQTTKRNNAQLMLTTAVGGALGAGARYIVPTKAEMKSFGAAADTFLSNANVTARGANRSILKYGAIGAVIAAGLALATKLIKNENQADKYEDTFEYSKYAALIEAPDIAGEFFLYDY